MTEPIVLGMDPHKRSVTVEAMDGNERVLGGGRYATTVEGYAQMLAWARQYPHRTWAIEGCNGIGRHVAERLLTDGENVVDVPPKLSARMRVFATGQGRKTDATDAPTPWPWSGCASPVCDRWCPTCSGPSCGCWSTGAAPSATITCA